MKTLLELGSEQVAIEEAIERLATDSEGELTDEIEQLMDKALAVELEVTGKLDKYGYVFERLAAEEGILKGRIASLQRRTRALQYAQDRLKRRLLFFMQSRELQEVKGDLFKFKVSGVGGRQPLVIADGVDAESLPPMFTKKSVSIDNDAVRQFLSDGNELEWAHLAERGTTVRIT